MGGGHVVGEQLCDWLEWAVTCSESNQSACPITPLESTRSTSIMFARLGFPRVGVVGSGLYLTDKQKQIHQHLNHQRGFERRSQGSGPPLSCYDGHLTVTQRVGNV